MLVSVFFLCQLYPLLRDIFSLHACFAIIPTLTYISRQSIFSGKIPYFFPNSILTTNKEESQWKNFWIKEGVSKKEIAYIKKIDQMEDIGRLKSSISLQKTKAIGIVINTIDSIMHGNQLGSTGMLNQIEHWMSMKMLSELLSTLLENHYNIWLTSDHGNIECVGQGSIREGSVPVLKDTRIHAYSTIELARKANSKIPNSFIWEGPYLPKSFIPVIAKQNVSFSNKNEHVVTHGGTSIEEVIVPFVNVKWKNQ